MEEWKRASEKVVFVFRGTHFVFMNTNARWRTV
jgi:hypothetical protein